MHSNSLAKHFFHIFHPTSLLPVPDALLLVSNRSQNFYQCSILNFLNAEADFENKMFDDLVPQFDRKSL